MKKFILLALVGGFIGCGDSKNTQNNSKYNKDAEELCQSIATFSKNCGHWGIIVKTIPLTCSLIIS